MTTNDVELRAVCFAYPGIDMVFDLHVKPSAITIVTGPSGSGKSTLLNLIAGFETPSSGTIMLAGQDQTALPPSMRPIAMMFQDHNVFSHLTVADNVGLGARANLKLTAQERNKVHDALKRVGLEGKADRLPGELSGGERQRVAFARILVQNRPFLVLDEPFASLGPALRQDMIGLLADLKAERNLTVLAVTHHPEEWKDHADEFVFIDAGRVSAQGPIKDLSLSNAAIKSYLG